MARNTTSTLDQNVSDATYAALTATHPRYDANIGRWVQYLDLYTGEHLGQYIHRHARESITSHDARKQRLVYRNYCAPITDLYLEYIFSKPTVRSATRSKDSGGRQGARGSTGLTSEWQEWMKNVDRKGTAIDRFMADQKMWAYIFGHVFVVVDVPASKETPATEAERKAMRLQPYLVSYFPTECTNWALDEDDKLVWIRFREQIPEEADPFAGKSKQNKKTIGVADPHLVTGNNRQPTVSARYRTWTRTGWYLHEISGMHVKLVDEGSHDLGEVPVAVFYNRRSARYPFIGDSLLKNIGRLNVEILNQDSLIQEAVYQQTLNILVLGKQPTDEEEIVIGANNVMEYMGDKPPFFLSPSTAPIVFMEDRIQRMREEVYRVAKIGGDSGTQPQAYPSGIALSFGFNQTSSMLAKHADECENSEIEVHRLWMKWLSATWEGTIQYPDEFDVTSFEDDLRQITSSKTAMRSPTFNRTMEKRAMRKALKTAEPELLAQIEQEIDFIPEMVSTFTGPIYYDPLRQTVNNPQPTGNPVGVFGDLTQVLGIQTEEQQKAVEEEQSQTAKNQQQMDHQKELAAMKQKPAA